MDKQNLLNGTVSWFFGLQLHTKINHWNTTSYARHKATDDFGSTLSSIIDKFVEVFIGKYNVKPEAKFKIDMNSAFTSDSGNAGLLRESRDFIKMSVYENVDSELKNILDELIAEIDKTLYLYNLK